MCSMGTVNSFRPPCNAFLCTLIRLPFSFISWWSRFQKVHKVVCFSSKPGCLELLQFLNAHKRTFLQYPTLILEAPGVLLQPSRAWGHVSQPCEDVSQSLDPGARREHGRVRALRRKCHQISRCAVWDFSLAHKEKMNWLKCYTSLLVLILSRFSFW